MSIQEMKQATRAMPPDERAEFMAWLDNQYREDDQHQEDDQYRERAAGETGEPVTFDDIKHLAGSVKGPGDLLSNPEYMDDFGKSSMR